MGSLTIGFMETTELTVVDVDFTQLAGTPLVNDQMNVTVTNSGTSAATISQVRINGNTITTANWALDSGNAAIAPGDSDYVEITSTWASGNKYSITFFDNTGTLIGSFTDTA